jgi:cytidylate kinase
MAVRVENVARAYDVPPAKAKDRIKSREEKRSAFIRKSFHKDVRNPLHYDLVINSASVSIDNATDMICLYLAHRYDLE